MVKFTISLCVSRADRPARVVVVVVGQLREDLLPRPVRLAVQKRRKRTALDLAGNRHAGQFQDRRQIVDVGDHLGAHDAAVPALAAGQPQQQGHLHARLVEPALRPRHGDAMVGGEDHQRVLSPGPSSLQGRHRAGRPGCRRAGRRLAGRPARAGSPPCRGDRPGPRRPASLSGFRAGPGKLLSPGSAPGHVRLR